MKLTITGASNFVGRMYEACGPHQWARETVKNALEAGATRVELGVEWQAVRELGVYRRTVADDGAGMDRADLLRFFSALGDGSKAIGGVHDNFGVGAKVSTLPWNPAGVVVVSYKGGAGAMVWLRLDPASGEYELRPFETDEGLACVVEPGVVDGIDWAAVRPPWLTDRGTVVVLLGSPAHPDTALGDPRAGGAGGLADYLDARFWDFGGANVQVVELPAGPKDGWPRQAAEGDPARRPLVRTVLGARRGLTGATGGTLQLADGKVTARWYLRPGDVAGGPRGFVALRYDGELFHVTGDRSAYRSFGVVEAAVQRRLTIVIDPDPFDPGTGWGVHPDQSRNRLAFTGGGVKGGDAPLADWGLEFAARMPRAVRDALAAARADDGPDDDTYRTRLREKFRERWVLKGLVGAAEGKGTVQATVGDGVVVVYERSGPPRGKPRGRASPPVRVRVPAARGGADAGAERKLVVDVPRFRSAPKENFEKPWHLAQWAPADPGGPTVYLNADAPVLREAIAYHQSQYPDAVADRVRRVVLRTFGEVAACKVAHAQTLTALVPAEEVDRDFRSEPALTTALMGLLAEDELIARRLGRLMKKANDRLGET